MTRVEELCSSTTSFAIVIDKSKSYDKQYQPDSFLLFINFIIVTIIILGVLVLFIIML